MIDGLTIERVGTPPSVLRLVGELDTATTEAFDTAVDHALQAGASGLTLDLSGLEFLGSIGLSSMLRARALVDEVEIRGCRRSVRRLFEASDLDRFFTFVDHAPA